MDQNLSIFERHRRADAAAYASVHSVLPNLERAAAYIQRGIKVTEDMTARPLLNEETRAQYPEIRARLAAMTQPQRMDAITKDTLPGVTSWPAPCFPRRTYRAGLLKPSATSFMTAGGGREWRTT